MRLTRIATAALGCIALLSSISCASPTFHLFTSVNGQGSVVPNSGDFLGGRTISIFANPAYGWAFDHWEGALSGNQSLANLIMNADKSITAYFVATNETPTQTFTQTLVLTPYTDETVGFSMSVPSSWEGAPIGDMGYMSVSPELCSGGYASCNVLKIESSGLSLQSAYEAAKSGVEVLNGYGFLSESETTVGDIPAITHIFTLSAEGSSVKEMQCILIKGNTGWVLTFASASTCWNTYAGTFNIIMNSFQVLE
jgi:hypothetical protein